MKIKGKLIPVFLLAVFLSAGYYFYSRHEKEVNKNEVRVSGNIEATDVRLAFRVPGKIRELLTDEGMMVKFGDTVARLEIDELTRIKDEAEASLKAARYAYERARDDYARMENLFKAGAISEQKRDVSRTSFDSAKANVDALSASLELAITRLGFAELSSPLDGFVLSKSAEAGEVVLQGSVVFTVADLKNIWLTAYINERDLGRVKLNQEVEVKTDTYPGKVYKGRVSFISNEAEFTPKQIQTSEERVKLVYRIKVNIDNPEMELKPGMPADGIIRLLPL